VIRSVVLLVAGSVLLGGCVERRLSITSEPPGASVWVNGSSVGLTPLETTFVFHGIYDIRIEKPGYEPLLTSAEARAPWWEYPPLDLAAEAVPFTLENTQDWHFVLEPSLEVSQAPGELESGLLDRAGAFRERLGDSEPEPEPEPETESEPEEAGGG